LRRALREDPETAAFVVATIGEHRPESATPGDLARSARARTLRRLAGLLKEAVRSSGLSQPQRFAAAESLALLDEGRVGDALTLLQEHIE
jgi:hypothetical protein